MIQPFVPSARGWLSGTGLRAKWDYTNLDNLRWNPQYLMGVEVATQGRGNSPQLKIGYRDVARSTDVRSFIGAVLPSFPCGNKVPILHLDDSAIDPTVSAMALLNSFVFDWLVRRRLGAATLNWYVLAEVALPRTSDVVGLSTVVKKLNLFPSLFAGVNATQSVETACRPASWRKTAAALDCGCRFLRDGRPRYRRPLARPARFRPSGQRCGHARLRIAGSARLLARRQRQGPRGPPHRPDAHRLSRPRIKGPGCWRRPRERHRSLPGPESRRRLDAPRDATPRRLRTRP